MLWGRVKEGALVVKREDVSDFHNCEVPGLSVLIKDFSRCFVLMKQFTCHRPK